ncbi:LytR family transcriptional attenuator [Ornithinimicrobium humiphilum]|uniref:LytR family transcriptional attenuator n=1 Tax=Ornithinimicrobium humiphilum TaxID=125288 RepID=A0A543KMB5_9MICO|nr:LCP family protein [Ornithinimicrobium humiphilum]TQM96229.1 LytR family transcriptional attenuator [Ornithinimicrobium humiphilum]
MPHNPEDDWTRPVPRSSRGGRGGSDPTRAVPRGGHDDRSWEDAPEHTRALPRGDARPSYAAQGYEDDGYGDGGTTARSTRGYYDENGDWVPRPRPRARTRSDYDDYDDYDAGYDAPAREDRRRAAAAPPAGRPPRDGGHGGGNGGRRPPRRRARYGVRRFLALLMLLVVAYVVTMAVVIAMVWGSIGRVDATPQASDRPSGGAGSSYLLVGTDSRDQLTDEERREFGTGDAEGSRADTVMLLHVPGLGGEPTLVSLPRDSYVPIRDQGWNKLNAAHSIGGPALLVDTVEQTTGMHIDGYMEIGFGGFVGVVEEVGGVTMCLDAPAADEKAHIDLPAGCQDLTGPEALGYVRMRYSDGRGDLGRVERQREFLAALVKRMASPATVLNPLRLHSVGTATGEAIALGEDTSLLDTARMALAMRTIAAGGGTSVTVPVENPDYPTNVGSTVLWKEQASAEMFAALREGRPVTVQP